MAWGFVSLPAAALRHHHAESIFASVVVAQSKVEDGVGEPQV